MESQHIAKSSHPTREPEIEQVLTQMSMPEKVSLLSGTSM